MGELVRSTRGVGWKINLRDSRIPKRIFFETDRIDVKFYFDVTNLSPAIKLFIGDNFKREVIKEGVISPIHVMRSDEMLENVISYKNLKLEFESIELSRYFRVSHYNLFWREVHDGNELMLSSLTNF